MSGERPRIILNDDGSNFLYSADDLGADDLRAYLAPLQGTQVDMVAYCVAFGDYVTYYESEVAEAIGTGFSVTDRVRQRRWAHNRRRLADEAGDYIGCVFETLEEMGIPALASLRMNDAHMSSDPTGPVAGRFWMNHPEWRLGERYGYYRSCLDYAQPAVREYLRRLVIEVLKKFPGIAGIELDGMRSPYFFQEGEGERNAPIMTDFIRTIRADLDEAATRNGRERYLLRVNVPRSPELALESGMDVAAWADEGLVGGVAPGCYGTDFQLPLERWQEIAGEAMDVHAYANCSRAAAEYHSLEEYRGAAANAWGAGADGIYLFNFPCLEGVSRLIPVPLDRPAFPPPEFTARGYHPDLTQTRNALREIGAPETLAGKDKRFLFYTAPSTYRHYAQEVASIERLVPEATELIWRCYEDYAAAETEVELKLVSVTPTDQFVFAINGEPVGDEAVERLHAPGGRDTRVHPCSLEPYSVYTLGLAPETLLRGENTLTVTMTAREPDLYGEVEVREMAVTVRYS